MIAANHYFSIETFTLLRSLHKENNVDFYLANSEIFSSLVQDPFQSIFSEVAKRLPLPLRNLLITDKDIFCRFGKHNHNLDFYWGAFNFSKDNCDTKLFMWINHEMIEFGLCSGKYNKQKPWSFSKKNNSKTQEKKEGYTSWLQNPNNNLGLSTVLGQKEVLSISREQLILHILSTFNNIHKYLVSVDNSFEIRKTQPSYTIKQCAVDMHISAKKISTWLKAIKHKKQAIIYGPPGTGKTYLAERLARTILSNLAGVHTTVQFHSSYSYEDFIQGLRPQKDGNYNIVNGTFLNFCDEAKKNNCASVLIIDEINRCAIDRVFGELMYLLEYRNRSVTLLSGQKFTIPEQIYIIGTMNTADKSIAILDYALRRRFAFIPLYPDYNLIRKFKYNKKCNLKALIETLQNLNEEISDQNFQIGTSFFLINDLLDHIENIWRFQIEPYIEEYFFNELYRAEKYRWNKICKRIMQT